MPKRIRSGWLSWSCSPARALRISTAQRTAPIAVGNSANVASPAVLKIRPSSSAILAVEDAGTGMAPEIGLEQVRADLANGARFHDRCQRGHQFFKDSHVRFGEAAWRIRGCGGRMMPLASHRQRRRDVMGGALAPKAVD